MLKCEFLNPKKEVQMKKQLLLSIVVMALFGQVAQLQGEGVCNTWINNSKGSCYSTCQQKCPGYKMYKNHRSGQCYCSTSR